MIVLVVLAFLVQTDPAHRKFRLAPATLRSLCAAIVLDTCDLLFDLPRIWEVGFSFKDAQLLLVRLFPLQCHLSWTAIPILPRGAAPPIPDLCFIDSTLRIDVVLDVAFK